MADEKLEDYKTFHPIIAYVMQGLILISIIYVAVTLTQLKMDVAVLTSEMGAGDLLREMQGEDIKALAADVKEFKKAFNNHVLYDMKDAVE